MIERKPYRMLCDFQRAYDFLSEVYERDCRNGRHAPFLEYAQVYPDFEANLSHRIALWEENGVVVAMAYYEIHIGKALMALRPGYERLIDEMIDYAEQSLCAPGAPVCFWMCSTQAAIRSRLASRGYAVKDQWPMKVYDFAKGSLGYALPEGYRFLDATREALDFAKLNRCCWRGFDHGDNPQGDGDEQRHSAAALHRRDDLAAIVVNGAGEYVCFAGMWLDARNGLAYLEPLCTVPECRRMGVAAAALTELQRRTSALGCTHMTGGGGDFYTNIGFDVEYQEEIWTRE